MCPVCVVFSSALSSSDLNNPKEFNHICETWFIVIWWSCVVSVWSRNKAQTDLHWYPLDVSAQQPNSGLARTVQSNSLGFSLATWWCSGVLEVWGLHGVRAVTATHSCSPFSSSCKAAIWDSLPSHLEDDRSLKAAVCQTVILKLHCVLLGLGRTSPRPRLLK